VPWQRFPAKKKKDEKLKTMNQLIAVQDRNKRFLACHWKAGQYEDRAGVEEKKDTPEQS